MTMGIAAKPLAAMSEAERARMVRKVREEIRMQQGTRVAREERARQIEHSRDRLLARDLEARRAQADRRPGFIRRRLEGLENAWAITWATMMLGVEIFALWGEALGLWVVEYDAQQH